MFLFVKSKINIGTELINTQTPYNDIKLIKCKETYFHKDPLVNMDRT